MTPVEKLHYALGEIAYAMVWSDDRIRYDEIGRFMEAITFELDTNTREFDLLGTMFSAITGEKRDVEKAYHNAMKEIKANADYFHPALKHSFIRALERVENMYAPFTFMYENRSLVDRFRNDVAKIEGTRVFMGTIFLN